MVCFCFSFISTDYHDKSKGQICYTLVSGRKNEWDVSDLLEEVGWPWQLMSPHGPTHQPCCNLFNSLLNILLLGFAPLFLCSGLHTPADQQTGKKARPLLPSTYHCGPAPRHVLTSASHHKHFQSSPCRQGKRCSFS